MFAPVMKIEKFEIMDVITTSVTCDEDFNLGEEEL